MSTFYRYDAIQLSGDAIEDDFLKLMKKKVLPHLKISYSKSTRTSICILDKQELFKDAKKAKKYIWLTTWSGREDAMSDLSFAAVTMFPKLQSQTQEMLKKIDEFGKRKIENVYTLVE